MRSSVLYQNRSRRVCGAGRNRDRALIRGMLLPVLIFLLLVAFLLAGVREADRTSDEKGAAVLEQAVRRAVVQCYAIEGMYPPDVDYLKAHYGIHYDTEKYVVHYEVFAGNVLPDITVIRLSRPL